MTVATSLAIVLQLLHWALFFSSVATIVIYGRLTKWNRHPTGRGLFWTCVGWSGALLITGLGMFVTEAILPYYLMMAVLLYLFMIFTVNFGMNRQIIREQRIGRANAAVKLKMKEDTDE